MPAPLTYPTGILRVRLAKPQSLTISAPPLLLVAMPFVPSSVLAPSSDALCFY